MGPIVRMLINIPLLLLAERRRKRKHRDCNCTASLKSCEADDCIELACDLGKLFD